MEERFQEYGADKITRKPTARGFYPFNKEELERKIEKLLEEAPEQDINPKGLISPHAGYSYSGKTAAYGYKSLENRDIENAVLLGVNHTGVGYSASVSREDWETPLGEIENSKEITDMVLENEVLREDERAHSQEHSIEVQLPFLQYLLPDIQIAPIVFSTALSRDRLNSISDTLNKVVSQRPKTLIVASSDLLHVGSRFGNTPRDEDPVKYVERRDKEFLGQVKDKNVDEVLRIGEQSTICGFIPITLALNSLKDTTEVEILDTSNSFEVSGDRSNVVGYASVAFI